MRIQFENDSELAEFEAYNKGYRNDIVVEVNGKLFRIYVTTMTRLKQDYETEISVYGFYQVEPNIVIVDVVKKEAIERTIHYLYRCKYFEKLEKNGF